MGKKPKLQKKPEESKLKVKPGKSQQQKGNSVVNEEENSAEDEDDEDSAIVLSVVLSIQMKAMCGCAATAVRHGMI